MAQVQGTMSPLGHQQGRQEADGSWVVIGSAAVALKLPITKDTPDAAVLYTVPDDARLLVEQAFWEVGVPFTGGTSSAIGVSSDTAPHETKGDILGGASGDVAAGLTAGIHEGTPGVSFSGAPGVTVIEGGKKIRFDRIASAFTAGEGYVHIIGRFIR